MGSSNSAPSSAEEKCLYVSFLVQMPSCSKQVDVFGETLGDLREAVRQEMEIPHFQQKIEYLSANGDPVPVVGDNSTPMKEKLGLLDVKELRLSRQVDPRLKTEKETAFLEALAAQHYLDVKEMLEDPSETSGVSIDPNCVFKATPYALHQLSVHKKFPDTSVTEFPSSYKHPAITVAMLAGLEYAVKPASCEPEALKEWLSHEEEVCQVVARLIQLGADVNAIGDETLDAGSAGQPSVDGKSPLCAAVQRGSPTLVKMLLDAKADPNHTVYLGGSANNGGRGPGEQLPDAFLNEVCNGSMSKRDAEDPRNKYDEDILELFRVSRSNAMNDSGPVRLPAAKALERAAEKGNKQAIEALSNAPHDNAIDLSHFTAEALSSANNDSNEEVRIAAATALGRPAPAKATEAPAMVSGYPQAARIIQGPTTMPPRVQGATIQASSPLQALRAPATVSAGLIPGAVRQAKVISSGSISGAVQPTVMTPGVVRTVVGTPLRC